MPRGPVVLWLNEAYELPLGLFGAASQDSSASPPRLREAHGFSERMLGLLPLSLPAVGFGRCLEACSERMLGRLVPRLLACSN